VRERKQCAFAALHNAEVAIEEWIETARDLGRAIPVPKGRLVLV